MKPKKCTEYSAGGIVFRKLKRGIEIAFLLDPFNKWTFAKGHIEKSESIPKAAMRETKEEMGIEKIKVITPLGKINWWFRKSHNRDKDKGYAKRGDLIHKFVHYYLMQVPYQTRLRPQKSEFIKAVRWVPLKKALQFSDYKDVEPILKKAIKILERYDTAR